MFFYTELPSPVGKLTLACDGEALCGLWLEGQKYFGATLPELPHRDDSPEVFARTKDWLCRYFAGDRPEISELPLRPIGGEFRQTVWECLCRIPYGQITTYGALAKEVALRLGKPSMSAQAIGGAVGHNPISILIPCHRVVGSNRSLTGYAGGLDKKIQLLTLEGIDMTRFFRPNLP